MLINGKENEEKNILIIDDEDANFFALAEVLKAKSYLCLSANNALEAFSVLKTSPNLTAIIMDLMMPGMDGIQLTESIKKEPKYSHIPIIMTTALTTNEYKNKANKAGVEYYITKPINIDQLVSILEQLDARATIEKTE
jgi:two-component system cell cycle response regulator DivK